MGIKTTPKQVSQGINALKLMLGTEEKPERLPAKAAYAVGKLLRASLAEMEHYNAEREKIFKEHGCTIDGDKWVHVEPAALTAAIKQVDELLDAETEVNALPLDLELFKDATVLGGFYGLDWAMKPDTQ